MIHDFKLNRLEVTTLNLNSVTYNSDIQNMILSNLDGWVIEQTTSGNSNEEENEINPFMTRTELQTKANKVITSTECELFYEETLDMAYLHTNRLNIDDLSEVETRAFIRAVCKWTASNLWNKYNIRVNNEDMEDTYVQSYGGLLYKSALNALQPFINQRVIAMSNIKNNDNDDDFGMV